MQNKRHQSGVCGGKLLDTKKNEELAYYSAVKQKDIEWLWYPYIPYGKVTLLQGDPGEGKSTFAIHLVALLTRGKDMPDGYKVMKPETAIYQCAEDGIADTIKPRLIAAGADCERVAYIIEEENALTLDDQRIEKAIEMSQAKLVIIDPIQAYMGQDGDLQSASRMRCIIGNLAKVASRHQCAILLVGHMTKSNSGKNLYRGLGSIDIAATARSVLMISRDKEDSRIRYVIPIKSSLAPEGDAIRFSLDKETGFTWLGKAEMTIEDISKSEDKMSKKILAQNHLLRLLENEDKASNDIFLEMEKLNISKRTVQDAKKELAIDAYREGSTWYWHLSQ